MKISLVALFFSTLVYAAQAAEISFEENFLGPFGRSAHIRVDGEVRAGDSAKIESFVNQLRYSDDLRIHVSFNSPGGSLVEGLKIGRYLADLPVTVTTNVTRDLATPGDCASACVFAYMGGQYRYLFPGSRLGVHQFYLGETADLSASEGVAVSQFLAGEIVEFIRNSRAKPEFFSLISSIDPDQIYWVPEEKLRDLRVVTDDIFDQKAEYKNVQGYFYLSLWQQSYYGENKMIAACVPGESMVFASYIQPADVRNFNFNDYTFEITINGVAMPPRSAEPAPQRDARWAVTNMTLEPFQLEALKTAKSFGARHVLPAGVFLGFEYKLEGSKLSELVSGCETQAEINENDASSGNRSVLPQQPRELTLIEEPIILPNTDLPGGDYNNQGIKGIEIGQCAKICRSTESCVGFAWVEKSGWCWPKYTAGKKTRNQGVISAILRQ